MFIPLLPSLFSVPYWEGGQTLPLRSWFHHQLPRWASSIFPLCQWFLFSKSLPLPTPSMKMMLLSWHPFLSSFLLPFPWKVPHVNRAFPIRFMLWTARLLSLVTIFFVLSISKSLVRKSNWMLLRYPKSLVLKLNSLNSFYIYFLSAQISPHPIFFISEWSYHNDVQWLSQKHRGHPSLLPLLDT